MVWYGMVWYGMVWLITLRRLVVESSAICQSFQILSNFELDNNAWILPNLSLKHTVKVTRRSLAHRHTVNLDEQLVETKFNTGTHRLDNYHKSLWQLINRTVQYVLA